MKLTEEQKNNATKQFEETIQEVNENKIEYASKKGNSKVNGFGDNPPNSLMQTWKDIKLMINLITDYKKGNYKEVPWNVIASVTGAVVYFISPIDAIPDLIPVAGYLDDAVIIKLALDFARDDLLAYEKWENRI